MRRAMAAALAAMLLFTGCATEREEPVAATESAEAAVPAETVPVAARGGEVALSMRPPQTLNPLENVDVTVDAVLKLVFEPLMVLDEQQKPQANAALLSGMSVAADGMSATLTLRGGVVWSDGVAVKASDVVYSVEMLRQAPADVVYKSSVLNIFAAEVVGDNAVLLRFVQPYSMTPYMLMFPIVPAHHYGAKAQQEKNAFAPLGNGLYAVEEYVPAEGLTLKASESAAAGRPYIDKVRVLIMPDRESDMNAFDQGITQVVAADITDWARYRGAQDARASEYATTYFEFVGFQHGKPLMQNVQVRRLAEAIATEAEFLATLYLDSAMRAKTPVSPASWLYEENTPGGALDEEAAKAALAGQTVVVLVNEENAERVRIAEKLAAGLTAAGAAAKVTSLPFGEFQTRLTAGDFDMFVGGYQLAVAPDLSFMFHSKNAGATNVLRYQSEAMDGMLAGAAGAMGDEALRAAMAELQKHIAEELPCVGLVFRKSAVVTSKKVYAEPVPVVNHVYAGMGDWFVLGE